MVGGGHVGQCEHLLGVDCAGLGVVTVVAAVTAYACVYCYAVQPCGNGRFAAELVDCLPDVYAHLLQQILEMFGICCIHVAHFGNEAAVFRH